MRGFIAGFIVGAGTILFTMHFHVVRSEEGFHVVEKVTPSMADIFVDIRGWDGAAWRDHAALVASLTKAERTDLLKQAAGRTISNAIDGLLPHKSGTSSD